MGIVPGCVGFRVQDSGLKFEATGVGLGFGVNADMFRGLGSGFHGLSLGIGRLRQGVKPSNLPSPQLT